jgi:methionyl-tRNA formyltransferase
MLKQSIVFLGSKPIGYHCLEYLIRQQQSLNIELAGVLTNEKPSIESSASISSLCEQHHIPFYTSLAEMPEADIFYSVQYHEILKKQDLAKAKKLAVNLHMAPLPEYRGCNQFSFAILDQRTEFGTTIHIMDQGIDHGDILFERRFSIPANCWVEDLYQLTFKESVSLFEESLAKILLFNFQQTPQADLIAARGESLHYRDEIKSIKELDLQWEHEKIERHVRACSMPGFEPPYFLMEGQKIYCTRRWK